MRYCAIKTKKDKCPKSHLKVGEKWGWTNNINEAYRLVESENEYQAQCAGCDCICEIHIEE